MTYKPDESERRIIEWLDFVTRFPWTRKRKLADAIRRGEHRND